MWEEETGLCRFVELVIFEGSRLCKTIFVRFDANRRRAKREKTQRSLCNVPLDGKIRESDMSESGE